MAFMFNTPPPSPPFQSHVATAAAVGVAAAAIATRDILGSSASCTVVLTMGSTAVAPCRAILVLEVAFPFSITFACFVAKLLGDVND